LTRIRFRPPDPVVAPAATPERTTATSIDVVADAALDPCEVGAPADQLTVGGGSMRSAPGEQDHGLEERGLARGVRAPDDVRPGPEPRLQRGIASEVEEADLIKHGRSAPSMSS
jgi:hypothetical protein